MKKIVFVFLLIVILSGCSSVQSGTIVGKNIDPYYVDVMLDDGNVEDVELTPEQFYSGNFEVGMSCSFRCIVKRCYPE